MSTTLIGRVSQSFPNWAGWNMLALLPASAITTVAWAVAHSSVYPLPPADLGRWIEWTIGWSAWGLAQVWLFVLPAILYLGLLWRIRLPGSRWAERFFAISLAPAVFAAVAAAAAWLTTLGGHEASLDPGDQFLYLVLLPGVFGGLVVLPRRSEGSLGSG